MPRAIAQQENVTYEEVVAAITAITIRHEKVTNKRIRAELGNRGSWETITKFKRRYYVDLKAGVGNVFLDLPETLVPIFKSFWYEAIAHADEELSRQIAELTEKVDTVQGELRQVISERDNLQLECADYQRQLVSMSEQLDSYATSSVLMKRAEEKLINEKSKAATEAEELLSKVKVENAAKVAQLELQIKELFVEHRGEVAKAIADRDAARDQVAYERSRSESEGDRWLRLIDSERQAAEHAKRQLEELKVKSAKDISLANQIADKAKIEADRLRQIIDNLKPVIGEAG